MRPPGPRKRPRDLQHATQSVRVVRVIEHHPHPVQVEAHQSPGVVVGIRAESRVDRRDVLGPDAEARRRERRAREVGDVVPGMSADGERHVGDRAEVVLRGRDAKDQPPGTHSANSPTVGPMPGQQFVVVVEREPAERWRESEPVAQGRRFRPQRCVVGIEHQQPVARDELRDGQLDVREPAEIVDAVLAEVIARDVRHQGDVGMIESQPAAQDAAARSLEDRRFDPPVAQHVTRASRPGIVAGLDQFASDVHAVRAAEPVAPALPRARRPPAGAPSSSCRSTR